MEKEINLPIETFETIEVIKDNRKYLELLSTKFPTVQSAATEIINLEAILNLPKGTEHFLADIHGEDEAFRHVLSNGSGVIKVKVQENFPYLLEDEIRELCTLIYYPEEKLKKNRTDGILNKAWYKKTLNSLIKLTRISSSKYTRSKTRKALPDDYRYIIEEMLHESEESNNNRAEYYSSIVDTMIAIDRVDEFIAALCKVIQKLTIDRLHIVGDIYDRGAGAHKVMDTLKGYGNYDIQWGNHDILWMGAACGSLACIANVVRICIRYANFETLEDDYGVSLLSLARFSMDVYGSDPCDRFKPKCENSAYNEKDIQLIAQMQKAISVIQFKLEHSVICSNPEFEADSRNLLHCIDFDKSTVVVDGVEYDMLDMNFPTIDPNDPYKLTEEESKVVAKLKESFMYSHRLQMHIKELYDKGSIYLKFNSNLLYHASVPLDENGKLRNVKINGRSYKGKKLYDKIDKLARLAFFSKDETEESEYAKDYMWYLWCGSNSPLFNKTKMATFENYFLSDKLPRSEGNGNSKWIDSEEICEMILNDFGILDTSASHIINGHIPVNTVKGESPIKAKGKRLVIDGGFSRSFHSKTGIAGYTLVYNSQGMQLIQHEPFKSRRDAVDNGGDIRSTKFLVERVTKRRMVADTDIGKELLSQVSDLKELLFAYRSGMIDQRK